MKKNPREKEVKIFAVLALSRSFLPRVQDSFSNIRRGTHNSQDNPKPKELFTDFARDFLQEATAIVHAFENAILRVDGDEAVPSPRP